MLLEITECTSDEHLLDRKNSETTFSQQITHKNKTHHIIMTKLVESMDRGDVAGSDLSSSEFLSPQKAALGPNNNGRGDSSGVPEYDIVKATQVSNNQKYFDRRLRIFLLIFHSMEFTPVVNNY